jgi:hypothetical protein
MHFDREQTTVQCLPEDALGEKAVEHAREKREDVDVECHGNLEE